MPHLAIRPAVVADAAAIARVQVETWQSTYAGQVSDSALAFFTDLERRERQWTDALTQAAGDATNLRRTFVGESEGRILGFAIAGPTRFEEGDPPEALLYQGEIYAIYVLARSQGQGLGAQLMEASADYLGRVCQLHGLLVWALETNTRARGFYERLGGQLITRRNVDLAGSLVAEVGYGWVQFGEAG